MNRRLAMIHRRFLAALLVLTLAIPFTPRAVAQDKDAATPGGDGSEFVGFWTGELEGMRELWQIKLTNGKWSIACNYYNDKGQVIGAFVGLNPTVADGKLVFTQKYQKPPKAGWVD